MGGKGEREIERGRTRVARPVRTIACISAVTFSRASSMKGICAATAFTDRSGMYVVSIVVAMESSFSRSPSASGGFAGCVSAVVSGASAVVDGPSRSATICNVIQKRGNQLRDGVICKTKY